jgi:hypothetical protein
MFERRSDDPDVNKNEKGEVCDKDWTIAQIVKTIRNSDMFTSLPARERLRKEWSAKAMKNFFRTNTFYKNDLEYDASNKTTVLKGWRLKVED